MAVSACHAGQAVDYRWFFTLPEVSFRRYDVLEVIMIRRVTAMLPVLIGWICIGLLSACAPEPQRMQVGHTPLASLRAAVTLAATAESATPAAPMIRPPAQETCVPGPAVAAVQYDIDATVDWQAHTVRAEQRVTYRNDTGRAQEKIVFNVEPNQEPDMFTLTRLAGPGDKPITDFILDGTRLTVPLAEPLPAGCELELVLAYDLVIPAIRNGYRHGHLGYWGYSEQQINLGMWFPLAAVFDPAGDWITPQPYEIGEHYVLQSADFRVRLVVDGAPDTVRVAGPGDVQRLDDGGWQFDLAGGRELTLSISDAFKVLNTSTASGVAVELFYLPDPANDSLDAPRHALRTAADALALFEDLYGPYPHKRLVVVQADFPDGMEFSGLVFVSTDWFRAWKGTPNDWLTLITVHEVAHQWWYAMVGNDQGRYPYLDEALAIYSELLYVENTYPADVSWWWNFRIESYAPVGFVDEPIYDFQSVRGYIDAVYLRGALMMQALRDDLGDGAFFAWLRRYAEHMRGQVAYPSDFWGTLTADAYATTEPVRGIYLQHADVLPLPDNIP